MEPVRLVSGLLITLKRNKQKDPLPIPLPPWEGLSVIDMRRFVLSVIVVVNVLIPVSTHAQRYQQLVKRGLEQLQKDSLLQAEATFREAMDADPLIKSNALLYQYIGNIQERRGEYQKALDSYKMGLTISATTTSLLLCRAALYLRLDNQDRAMADYTEVLNLEPDQTEALFFRAYLYSQRRDYKRARVDYDRLVKLDPMNEKARLGLAILNDKDRRPREAMEQLDALVQLFPSHAELYLVRGGMLLNRKQYELAQVDIEHAIELEPENPDCYVSRSQLYKAMKKKKLAQADAKRAIRLGADPSFLNATFVKKMQ